MLNEKYEQPLYSQLVNTLKEEIENNLSVNDKLPSERDLSVAYDMSRTTVRAALNELEIMGHIYRQHGKGTFVSNIAKTKTDLGGTFSFTKQMVSLGKEPSSRIISFDVIGADDFIAQGLKVDVGTKVIKLKRLRLASGEPMMLERTYLPFEKFSTLTEEELSKRAMYDIFLDKYNQVVKTADEALSAGVMSGSDAVLLNFYEGAPVLKLERTTYNTKNEVVEFTLSVARGDKFVYYIRHIK